MQSSVTFKIRTTGPSLIVVARIDDQEIYHGEPGQETVLVRGEFDDDIECERKLTISLLGKLPEHTRISESGEILEDRVVEISDLCFDDIALGHVMTKTAAYTHDQNGTAPMAEHQFYGTMGCNGTVELKFSSPMYLWLLENM